MFKSKTIVVIVFISLAISSCYIRDIAIGRKKVEKQPSVMLCSIVVKNYTNRNFYLYEATDQTMYSKYKGAMLLSNGSVVERPIRDADSVRILLSYEKIEEFDSRMPNKFFYERIFTKADTGRIKILFGDPDYERKLIVFYPSDTSKWNYKERGLTSSVQYVPEIDTLLRKGQIVRYQTNQEWVEYEKIYDGDNNLIAEGPVMPRHIVAGVKCSRRHYYFQRVGIWKIYKSEGIRTDTIKTANGLEHMLLIDTISSN